MTQKVPGLTTKEATAKLRIARTTLYWLSKLHGLPPLQVIRRGRATNFYTPALMDKLKAKMDQGRKG